LTTREPTFTNKLVVLTSKDDWRMNFLYYHKDKV